MRKISAKPMLYLIGVVVLASIALVLFRVTMSQEVNKRGRDQEPIVSYESPEFSDLRSDQLRKIRGSRYDRKGSEPIGELPPGIEPLPEIDHWLSRLPALPVANSDLILIGDVTDAHAYPSSDRTGIYSEFNIHLEALLKDDNPSSVISGDSVTVERAGGAVRFSSGRIRRYRTLNHGMPQINKRYVLFLKRNEQGKDFLILTGYELREGRVFPLDARDATEKNVSLSFSAYEGYEESVFLKSLRDSVAHSSQP